MTSTAPSPSSGTIRRIETDADVAEGATWLAAYDPRLAAALDLTGPLPLRRRADGFRALLGAIVSQQVSVASANAIVARCEAAALHDPDVVRTATDEDMRACGLSRQKIRYISALAEAQIDFDALRTADAGRPRSMRCSRWVMPMSSRRTIWPFRKPRGCFWTFPSGPESARCA